MSPEWLSGAKCNDELGGAIFHPEPILTVPGTRKRPQEAEDEEKPPATIFALRRRDLRGGREGAQPHGSEFSETPRPRLRLTESNPEGNARGSLLGLERK